MIPVAQPWMGEEEAAAARRAILSGWVTQGPEVAAFEREFAEAVGASHACAVSSCTTAMHVALVALGVGPGHEVVTVSHSFIATANVVRYCGATPVFVDVEPDTCNINPTLIEAAISPVTRAILCVHQLGMPCDLRAVRAIAARHGLPVVEDAACAVGSEMLSEAGAWERIGLPHADIACFSFHPRKLLSTGDGGMLTTADPVLDARFRLLRQHGMDVPDTVRHAASTVVTESYPTLGYNYRMTDIQAAIGRVQLTRLSAIVERRRLLAARYARAFADVSAVSVPHEPSWARSNWQSYAIRLTDPTRQRPLMQQLLDAGIATRRGAMNAHREGAYSAGAWRAAPGGLAVSEHLQDTTVVLPLFHALDEARQDQVIASVMKAVEA